MGPLDGSALKYRLSNSTKSGEASKEIQLVCDDRGAKRKISHSDRPVTKIEYEPERHRESRGNLGKD